MDVSSAIAARRTWKVLSSPDAPLPEPVTDPGPLIDRMIGAAERAPYHHTCDPSHRVGAWDSPVPWRVRVVPAALCRRLAARIARFDGPVEKTVGLLGAADALLLVHWLPDPADDGVSDEGQLFHPSRRNMEHVAATAAAIQNMLLVATAAGVRTFWSSGGPFLMRPEIRSELGVPDEQILLGAVYLFPADEGGATVKPGPHHGQAGPREGWSTRLTTPTTD